MGLGSEIGDPDKTYFCFINMEYFFVIMAF